jgi:2-keto-3-deoxy-L-fuconate dehydrogenase
MKNKIMENGNFDLSGKCAIVTGGASGIGFAISTLFAKKGANVFILDANAEVAAEAVNKINDANKRIRFLPCNVTDEDMVADVFQKIRNEFSTIDILVNSAGVSHIGNVETTSMVEFQKVFDVNVKGTFLCIRDYVKKIGSAGGVILNIASIAGFIGLKDRFAYSMSKGAVLAMTFSVARDYIDKSIRCNSISPARIHTPFVDGFINKNYPGKEQEMLKKLSESQPIGRMGRPDEVAALALYLCSEEASFITGSDYPIDGGFVRLNN